MKNRIDNLLKAINLANYDAVDNVEVSISDLIALKNHIELLREQNKALCKQIHILDSKLSLRVLERPIKLDRYI